MQNSALIGELYQQFRDEDGFIYIMYSGENTFGSEDCTCHGNDALQQMSRHIDTELKGYDREVDDVYSKCPDGDDGTECEK